MNIFGVGGLELLVILVIAMLVLGPTRLVDYTRSLGRISREFRRANKGIPLAIEEFLEGREGQARPDEDDTEVSYQTPDGSKPRPRQLSPETDAEESHDKRPNNG